MNQSRDRRWALALVICLAGPAWGQAQEAPPIKIDEAIRKSVSDYLKEKPDALASDVATVDPSKLELVDGKLVWTYQRKAEAPLTAEAEGTLGEQLRKVLESATQKFPIQGDAGPLIKGLSLKGLCRPRRLRGIRRRPRELSP